MACASARLVGVVRVAIASFAPFMAANAVLEDITKRVVRAWLCVESSEKSVTVHRRHSNFQVQQIVAPQTTKTQLPLDSDGTALRTVSRGVARW